MIAERLILQLLIEYMLIFLVFMLNYLYICIVLADQQSRLALMFITIAFAQFDKIVKIYFITLFCIHQICTIKDNLSLF